MEHFVIFIVADDKEKMNAAEHVVERFMEMLIRRGFITEMPVCVNGIITKNFHFGPLGSLLRRNILKQWYKNVPLLHFCFNYELHLVGSPKCWFYNVEIMLFDLVFTGTFLSYLSLRFRYLDHHVLRLVAWDKQGQALYEYA